MNKNEIKIHIIGGGVSGLISARVLEDHGYSPSVIEATDRVGGRLKTDVVEGYQLDHGFQVLLAAYPAAQKYLDYKALDLHRFLPGAAIFKNGKQKIIGDPLRDMSLLFPTLFAGIGTFSDKVKILKLNKSLKEKTLAEIFSKKEQSTLAYLNGLGFSLDIIDTFFKPFFSGIFLETKLDTSSRMFEFVYKMFGEGYATLPKAGIEAIPQQLLQNLSQTRFRYNTKVDAVTEGEITLVNGERLKSDFTIVATEASKLIKNLKPEATAWKSCDTFYFETESRAIKKPLIGLVPKNDSVLNNIFYHSSLETEAKAKHELLSVTVVDRKNLEDNDLLEQVKHELKIECGIDAVKFIKQYTIPKALPNLADLHYENTPKETRLNAGVFLAGDTLLNGSLNAAILSGESAALAVVEALNNA